MLGDLGWLAELHQKATFRKASMLSAMETKVYNCACRAAHTSTSRGVWHQQWYWLCSARRHDSALDSWREGRGDCSSEGEGEGGKGDSSSSVRRSW